MFAVYATKKTDDGKNQCKIFEIAKVTDTFSDFADKELNVATTAAQSLTTGQWYVMKSGDNYFTDTPTESGSYTSTVRPRGMATDKRMYLVHLVSAGDGNYYVQSGYGNYLFTLPNAGGYITTRVSETKYSTATLMSGWDFYPVTLQDPLRPTASEIYTLKAGDAPTDASKQWIFVPTETEGQYYMYNVSSRDFAIPSGSTAWTHSTAASPVILESQGVGTHIAKTVDGTPIEYNDGNGNILNIVKVDDIAEPITTQLNNALNLLLSHQTKITDMASITDGWYAIRIHSDSSHPTYDGNFLYTLVDEHNTGDPYTYPIAHQGSFKRDPARDEAVYYFRLWPLVKNGNTYYHWQLPNGKYIVNYLNYYPISYTFDPSDFILVQDGTDDTFNFRSSDFLVQAKEHYVGRTARKFIASTTKLDIHAVDLTAVGLVAWQVLFNDGADNTKLHCTRSDVHGLTDVYNHGYFFLPTGVTPSPSDFTMDGMYGNPDIHTEAKTISVVYAPDQCFTADDVTVVQGSRTTGKGNTRQALLRIKINPQAPFYPDRFNISLTNAAQLTQVQAYMTNTEQLHAAGASPVLLGTQSTIADGAVSINVSGNHLVSTGGNTYLWITADIKSTAGESNIVDAAVTSIVYHNVRVNEVTCDVSAKGNPDGDMRIFLRQAYTWVSGTGLGLYYRNPALMRTTDGIIAVGEYRYDNPLALGKSDDGSDNGHLMDIVMLKSTDNGTTWGSPVTIAAGTPGSASTAPTGYGNPALVRCSDGKLICLMAAGSNSYDSSTGLKNIACSYSTDNGATWSSEPANIFNSIKDWNGLTVHSAYVPSGKGVTFPNGRIAFVLSGKANANATTNEYILYSDDDGANWSIASSTSVFGNGNDGKLEVMNDNVLLASIRPGGETVQNGRGYNKTTGDASDDGIGTWGTSSNWGSGLNSYGCNNDIFYFGRSTEGSGIRDAILHTVIKKYESERFKDLRIFVSFDQSSTWKEMFTIQTANAAASSMQKLADGNLALIFEDGSIGNDEDAGCYALNCVVISKEQIEAQLEDLYTAKVITFGETGSGAPYVVWGEGTTNNWKKSFTTTVTNGVAGVVVSTEHYAFNRANDKDQRVLCIRPSAANTQDVITITAPDGYIIKSYTITGHPNNSNITYTLANDNGSVVLNDVNQSSTLSDDNIYYKTTSFTFQSTGGNGNYADFTNFIVVLAKEYTVNMHSVGGKSYSTLYVPFDLYQTDANTKAYYITTVTGSGNVLLMETRDNGRTIPHHTAVTLINSADLPTSTFAVIGNQAEVVDEGDNMLKGILVDTEIDFSKGTPYYSLGKKNGKAGFYKSSIGVQTLGANRAYLQTDVEPVSNSNGFPFTLDDSEGTLTSISMEPASHESTTGGAVYDLQGRVVNGSHLQKGIYIRNGKKILVK